MSMRIGVIGAGSIGRTLAGRLADAGHDVMVGVRDISRAPGDLRGAAVGNVGEAIGHADVTIVAIPGLGLESFVEEWAAAIGSRIVIDATNNVAGGGPLHGMAHWSERAPDTPVFRAFCTAGWETFADPSYGGVDADLFYCGPAGQHAEAVERLIQDVGLRPVRVGDADAADVIDGVTRLWLTLAFQQGRGRGITVKLLER
jgi:8-hydroxy-5-deazaflavin:NADPH oxidoreductase